MRPIPEGAGAEADPFASLRDDNPKRQRQERANEKDGGGMEYARELHRRGAGLRAGVGAGSLRERTGGCGRSLRQPDGMMMRAMAVEFPEVLGQPGRLHHLEQRVEQHEQGVQRLKGMAGAFGGLLTALHALIAYFGGKH